MMKHTDLEWEAIEGIATGRSSGKEHYASRRNWNEKKDVVGVAAEKHISLKTNLPMDMTIRRGGDNGIDFILDDGRVMDAKGSTFLSDPLLKHPVGAKHWADVY